MIHKHTLGLGCAALFKSNVKTLLHLKGFSLGEVEHHLTYSSLRNVSPFSGDSIIKGHVDQRDFPAAMMSILCTGQSTTAQVIFEKWI